MMMPSINQHVLVLSVWVEVCTVWMLSHCNLQI